MKTAAGASTEEEEDHPMEDRIKEATAEVATESAESAERKNATGIATVAMEAADGGTAAGAATELAEGRELDWRSKARIPNY